MKFSPYVETFSSNFKEYVLKDYVILFALLMPSRIILSSVMDFILDSYLDVLVAHE